ncbi:Lrp/AsnC family transcriptional regulator [Saccharothrix isguenensis]
MFELDALDRRVVAGLQVNPRVSWGELGDALGEHQRTVGRRAQRIFDAGVLRTTAVPDDLLTGLGTPIHVGLRTTPGTADGVAASLAARADTRGVFVITGSHDVWCEVVGDLERRHDVLANELPTIDGVITTDSRVVLHTFTTVAEWHAPYLTDAEVAVLRSHAEPVAKTPGERVKLDDVDRRVIELLRTDGRMSFTAIAEQLDVSVPTAARRVALLLGRGLLHMRAEIDPRLLGLTVEAQIGVKTRAADIDACGRALSKHSGVRYCAALTGDYSLLLEVCLMQESELYWFLNEIGAMKEVVDVSAELITRAYKRGSLVTRTGS